MKPLFIIVYALSGEPDSAAKPYLDDTLRSAMTEENCQEMSDDLNMIDEANEYWCETLKREDLSNE